jgi:hypothetical protein
VGSYVALTPKSSKPTYLLPRLAKHNMGLSKSSDSLHHLRLTIDGLWFHFTCTKGREFMGNTPNTVNLGQHKCAKIELILLSSYVLPTKEKKNG